MTREEAEQTNILAERGRNEASRAKLYKIV